MKKRMFIALDLSEEIKKNLAGQTRFWLEKIPNSRPVRPKNLHLTLKFLGLVTDDEIWEIVLALKKIAENSPPFQIKGRGVLALPSFSRAKVIACALEKTSVLENLSEKIAEAADFFNLGKNEAKAFAPHITLARLKRPGDLSALADRKINFIDSVDSFQLMESDLSGPDPIYYTFQNFKLCGQ